MTHTEQSPNITPDLARELIAEQFPEYAHLPITSVEKQGHDNRTYRLGSDMLIRMPTHVNPHANSGFLCFEST